VKAGDLVKDAAQLVGGRGGGKPDLAQAGGPDPAGLDKALARIEELATGALK
jgi:alanyl-tRNA synthetase